MQKLLLLLCASVIMGGCSYYHTTSEPYTFSKEVIWKTAYKVIEKRYDIQTAKKEEGTIETEWDYKLSPMYLDSYRDRVSVLIERCDQCKKKSEKETSEALKELGLELPEEEDPDKGKKKFVLKISVVREQNRSAENPSAKDEAFWFPDGFNSVEEQRIISLVQAQLDLLKYLKKDEETTQTSEKDSTKQNDTEP